MENTARQKWALTHEAFEGLLAALGPDRDRAAEQYLEIRRNLVRLFEWRGCTTPDDYADETINRCARKIGEGQEIQDVATYCFGIARMMAREMSRDRALGVRSLEEAPEPQSLPQQPADDTDLRVECLRRCLAQLPAENRDLILAYYQGDKSDKITNRKKLTKVFGLRSSTLRMRALRLREALQRCSEACLERQKGKPL